MKPFKFSVLLASLFALVFVACTADGESMEDERIDPGDDINRNSNNDVPTSSSGSSDAGDASLDDYIKMVSVPAVRLVRSAADFDVDEFLISETEVTRGVYRQVMTPKENRIAEDDALPITDVSWYGAVLFCNALSKTIGADTAYVYDSVGVDGKLVGLRIAYDVVSVRLPTEAEWEVAARAGTNTTYYWGTAEASKYAYYAQSKGPVEVAQYEPNEYGLYDMGGNVAEWMNDWFGVYPTSASENYTGPKNGEYRVVRGGGWSDKASALASGERDKKIPLYAGQTVGFRIVYSTGF